MSSSSSSVSSNSNLDSLQSLFRWRFKEEKNFDNDIYLAGSSIYQTNAASYLGFLSDNWKALQQSDKLLYQEAVDLAQKKVRKLTRECWGQDQLGVITGLFKEHLFKPNCGLEFLACLGTGKLEEDNVSFGPLTVDDALRRLVEEYIKNRQYSEAFRVATTIRQTQVQSMAFYLIEEAIAANREWDKSIQLMRKFGADFPRFVSFILCRCNQAFVDTKPSLEEDYKAAMDMSAAAVDLVGEIFKKKGLNDAIEVISSIHNGKLKIQAYNNLSLPPEILVDSDNHPLKRLVLDIKTIQDKELTGPAERNSKRKAATTLIQMVRDLLTDEDSDRQSLLAKLQTAQEALEKCLLIQKTGLYNLSEIKETEAILTQVQEHSNILSVLVKAGEIFRDVFKLKALSSSFMKQMKRVIDEEKDLSKAHTQIQKIDSGHVTRMYEQTLSLWKRLQAIDKELEKLVNGQAQSSNVFHQEKLIPGKRQQVEGGVVFIKELGEVISLYRSKKRELG